MYEQEIQVLKALANGVNYYTGEKCDDDCILNDVKIIRTLYEVCDQLKSCVPAKTKKMEFVCPYDLFEKFEYEKELSITKILYRISHLYPQMKPIKYSVLAEAMIERGLLERIEENNGATRIIATESAQQYGIRNVSKVTMYGRPYEAVVYDSNGQKAVLSIIKELY